MDAYTVERLQMFEDSPVGWGGNANDKPLSARSRKAAETLLHAINVLGFPDPCVFLAYSGHVNIEARTDNYSCVVSIDVGDYYSVAFILRGEDFEETHHVSFPNANIPDMVIAALREIEHDRQAAKNKTDQKGTADPQAKYCACQEASRENGLCNCLD